MAYVDLLCSEIASTTYRTHLYIHLIFPRNSLHPQKFLDTRTAVEAAKTAHFGAAMWEIRFVVDGHTVDVDGTIILRQQMLSDHTLFSSHAAEV